MVTPETTTPVPRFLRDPHPFDRLVMLTSGGAPRRRVLQGLLSALLAGMPGTFQHERAVAKRCTRAGKLCGSNSECCSGFCEPIRGQCVARCDQGSGICATDGGLAACAKGCSCYFVELGNATVGRACLRNPTHDLSTLGQECPGTRQCSRDAEEHGGCPCSGPADCPTGSLCTASSCCSPDAVCLRLCDPDDA
jgi:hypothetical protein